MNKKITQFMKQNFTIAFFCLAFAGTLSAQNVGIGTPAPVDKLHVAGVANSIRIEGLSSTGTYTGTGTPLRAVFVDANGSLVKGGAGATFTDAWYTVGNAGTIAGANFVGTTDAQAFVTKTGGSAAANERMRILATGAGVFNATTPFAGDVFSVYGTGYAGATNALGAFVVNSYVGANGTAIYGESNSAAANSGIAVWGQLLGTSTPATITSYGTLGRNTTVPVATGFAIGAGGVVTATSGDARGVNGSTASNAGIGVAGFNSGATGSAFGLYGQSSSSAGIGGIGVVTSTAAGLQGQNAGTGDGIRAHNTSATAATAGNGIYGQTNATNAFGARFINANANGTGAYAAGNNVAGTYLTVGSGAAFNGLTTGAFGNATQGTSGTGLTGRSNGAAILTIVDGSGTNGVSTFFGVTGFSTSAALAIRAGGYFETNAGQSFAYVGARTAAGVNRKIEGNGTVNTTVKDVNNKLVVLSCPEAPENLFQDYGIGQLVNGKAHITIDPTLAKNIVVNAQHPLRVFVQLEGDCNGVYVANKTQNSFDVIELAGGASNVSFSWSIVANRADEVLSDGTVSPFSSERFAPAMGPQATQTLEEKTATQKNLNEMIQAPRIATKDIDKVK